MITPSHFLSPNKKTCVPIILDKGERDDPDFEPYQPSSKSILLKIWKKGQRLLELFWKIWQSDYLLSLQERSILKLKPPRIEANETPQFGDIVQLKKDLHRGSWKLAKIVELITSNDGNIRAAKFLLSTKNVVNRPLNLLYPLECQHEHRQMSREMPKTEQADLNIKETEKIKNSQSFRAKNVNPTKKTTQNLILKETQRRLHDKLKTEYSVIYI